MSKKPSDRERATLAAHLLLERYYKLHSGNCQSPVSYRRTLLKRLAVVLPLSSRKERVTEGHLI